MPRTNFPKGVSNLTKLRSSEMPGILLSLLTDLSCDSGKSVVLQAGTLSDESQKKFCQLIQTVLGYQAWIDLETSPKLHVEQLRQKVAEILHLFHNTVRREVGMGMKVAKFHTRLHMQWYCEMFGMPEN